MFQLFTKDSDGEVVVNKEVLLLIPAFKKVASRLMKVEGDHDGRKKLRNKQELAYIWFMCDWESPLMPLPDFERGVQAIYMAGLPNDWKPDEEVDRAKEFYIETQETANPEVKLLTEIRRTLNSSSIIVEFINERIARSIEELKNGDIDDTRADELVEKLINGLTRVQSLATGLNKQSGDLAMIEDKVRKNQGLQRSNVRGDKDGLGEFNRENLKRTNVTSTDSFNSLD